MENVKYRFIQNVGDYFPSGYFDEDFLDKIKNCAGSSSDDIRGYANLFTKLRAEYDKYKNNIVNQNCRRKDAIKYTHDFNTELLKALGYETENPYDRPFIVNDKDQEYIPVRHVLSHNGKVRMLVMEMQNMIQQPGEEEPAGLFNQRYNDEEGVEQVKNTQQRYRISDWEKVFAAPEGYKISPAIINKAISQLFLMPEDRRPHFILMLAGNIVFLFDCDKWSRGAYLIFDLDELFSQASLSQNKGYYGLFYLLVAKSTLAADSEVVLMDTIIEDSYKKAYEVTQDLKTGVVTAVEELANEALYYMKNVAHKPFGKRREDGTYDETDDSFEAEIKDDCLTIVYRLLFIFYAESRTELGILPTNDNVYNLGYSLEMLRDLEQVRLVSQETRDGYFFDDSISKLFRLMAEGHKASEDFLHKSFKIRKVDSPLFDNGNLKHLGDVKIRNSVWQKIVCSLSLSKKNKKCGRISYANLGVNQLGSVYESLLAYRGFYAEEDYIEVYAAGNPEEGTFLVPYSRHEDFDSDKEILKNENGEPKILKKGSFVYRLNGRDRQKSASYYTPEVLTRSTVKYTLKEILEEVKDGKRKAKDLLELKILEPAMGAAAFQNEVINQLAEAYLNYQRIELEREGKLKKLIPPDQYQNELQKVKAYIATHNVYGVDLNPTAIELGKISLWLNVIHKDMQPPFFGNRLALGNAVLGTWLKVYSKSDLNGSWWEKSPHKVQFGKKKVKRGKNEVYHFLLPDANMVGVRSLTEQKEKYRSEYARMNAMVGNKQWTKPISTSDFDRMELLSAKIDYLLKKHLEYQLSIEKQTDNCVEIWNGLEQEGSQIFLDPYATKAAMNAARYNKTSAYYRLKMVMDYWCTLWFWEYADANLLPTREQFWEDINKILDVPDELVRKQSVVSDDEAEDIKLRSKEELLASESGQTELNLPESGDDTDKRFALVARYSERYRFFHPMMEFIEVFWLNGGFDIICGNPPFLKWRFEAQDIISEKFPEVVIREKVDADAVMRKLKEFLENEALKKIYYDEMTEVGCCKKILNAPSLYSLLKGQQTDLFKCIFVNSLEMLSEKGFMGMIHPNEIFDEGTGQVLREYVYPRLVHRFQYQNSLSLFSEVEEKKIFDCAIYSGTPKDVISFDSINNLYHPNTVDACYAHTGIGMCGGLSVRDEKGHKKPNLAGHKNRIINYDENMLKLVSAVFEEGADWKSCCLVSLHSTEIIEIVKKMAGHGKVSVAQPFVTEAYHATNAVKREIIRKEMKYPDISLYEMIFYSSQVDLLSPISMESHHDCMANFAKMDSIDYTKVGMNFIPRTNYLPNMNLVEFKKQVDESGEWFGSYKLGFRKMLDQLTSERTLKGAILPPKSSHTNSIISIAFKSLDDLLVFAGLSSSTTMDFFVKVNAAKNLTPSRLLAYPFTVNEKYKDAIAVRALRLNCVNSWYADLWTKTFKSEYSHQEWSLNDSRLSSYADLTEKFTESVLLRNEFERRLALIELDVISAMAFGLSFDELMFIDEMFFQISKNFDENTWYDQNGRMAFSTRTYELDLDRKTWESIRGNKVDDYTYEGTSPSYSYTISPKQSELYGGSEITITAPYTRCDRIADYRRAWAHFEKQFN